MNEIVTLILAILLLVSFVFIYRANKALKDKKDSSETSMVSDISQLKSIGELSVFQIYSKEIITKTDHAFGNFGKEYLRWLISEKKLSMIFEFEINFIYDLRSTKMEILPLSSLSYLIKMPPCKYKFSIANMKFYDEENGRFIPFLLPDSLNGFFGGGFREEDKNRLIMQAREEAEKMSIKLISDLEYKIHKSAADTLEAIAKSFGVSRVSFEFNDNKDELTNNPVLQNIA
ncbi:MULTISPECIES: DUF4230 domain-containing protein [unclassified Campylobacter]|uniref:DUF4230 domain-containing protein n=1 Tax=unclassified Campylobacter TaxID=2593542 RepID=UPI003D32DB9B